MSGVNLVPAFNEPTAPRTRRHGCLRAAAVTTLVLLALADLLIVGITYFGPLWPVLLVVPPGLAAVLWPAVRRPAWLTPQLRTAVPAGLSVGVTAVAAVTGEWPAFGPGEAVIMLCLLMIAVRTCPPRWAIPCAVLTGAAVIALPLRLYRRSGWSHDFAGLFGYMLVLALLVGIVAGLSGYLRTLDHRRGVAITETRRSERLAMAADLHDFVAHHVTGILVQTQMARMMVTTEPGRLDPVLAGIENAATEALSSMRRTVGVLREVSLDTAESESADRRPVGDLAALADMVAGFGGAIGPRAVLRRDASVPTDLPHEVQAAAHRLVQEALTNVRRHAADATEVTVALAYDDGTLQVTVHDNGRGGTQMPHAARGGGFGIVGLTERVTALGGELRAGPHEDEGWEIQARLPAVGSGRNRPEPPGPRFQVGP